MQNLQNILIYYVYIIHIYGQFHVNVPQGIFMGVGQMASKISVTGQQLSIFQSSNLFYRRGLLNATTKRFYMMVNYPLPRRLGNIAKVYSVTFCQSTVAKLKKYEFCPVGHCGIAHMYVEEAATFANEL